MNKKQSKDRIEKAKGQIKEVAGKEIRDTRREQKGIVQQTGRIAETSIGDHNPDYRYLKAPNRGSRGNQPKLGDPTLLEEGFGASL